MATTLGEAVSARHQVGIAQGRLMAVHAISADEAFARLRHYGNTHNLKLRAVAGRAVESGDLPPSG